MSEAEEMREGRQAATEISKTYDIYGGLPALQNYVDEIGRKLAGKSHRPHLDYRFTVVDSPQVDVFALPGGHIYVTRGILAYLNSEAELAAVLGHEIGHVIKLAKESPLGVNAESYLRLLNEPAAGQIIKTVK